MLLFSILMSGGHLSGHLDVYYTLKITCQFCEKS
eukprot:UN11927